MKDKIQTTKGSDDVFENLKNIYEKINKGTLKDENGNLIDVSIEQGPIKYKVEMKTKYKGNINQEKIYQLNDALFQADGIYRFKIEGNYLICTASIMNGKSDKKEKMQLAEECQNLLTVQKFFMEILP